MMWHRPEGFTLGGKSAMLPENRKTLSRQMAPSQKATGTAKAAHTIQKTLDCIAAARRCESASM